MGIEIKVMDVFKCPETCGTTPGIRQRQVVCLGPTDNQIEVETCELAVKPNNTETCPPLPSCPESGIISNEILPAVTNQSYWKTGDWSNVSSSITLMIMLVQCNRRCGRGWQIRSVQCMFGEANAGCDPHARPPSHQSCRLKGCPQWRIEMWQPVVIIKKTK